jgi:hypothetical protein
MQPGPAPPPPSPAGPPPPGGPGAAATGTATTVLVLAIVGLLCCPITSPMAWVMGSRELRAIARGEAPVANRPPAQVGMVLGILGTAILAFSLLCGLLVIGISLLTILVQA